MNASHPTTEQIGRYRDRSAAPDELLRIDAHLATCDRCLSTLGGESADSVIVTLAPTGVRESDHLTYDEMERWVDGRAEAIERELFQEHVADCKLCRDERDDLDRVRENVASVSADVRPIEAGFTWRLSFAAAAVIAVVIGIGWVLRREGVPTTLPKPLVAPSHRPSEGDALRGRLDAVRRAGTLARPEILSPLLEGRVVLRGGESTSVPFTLLKPIATVVRDPRPEFRWTALPDASSYTLAVVDADTGAVVARGSSDDTLWRPDKPLAQGKTYSWQVTARRRGERITEPRPPAAEARFIVASADTLNRMSAWERHLQDDPAGRGILLAEEGFLDDAEHELQLASQRGDRPAQELLNRVRAWRRDIVPETR